MATITYGEHTRDLATLPESSLVALASAGLAHTMGNVVASKVVSEVRKAINPEKPGDVTTDAIKVWRASHAEQIAAMTQSYQLLALKAIDEGSLGVHVARAPGASTDPLGAEMRKIAREQITAILGAAGMKFPGKAKGVEATVTLAGKQLTGEALIANRLNPDYPKNNREAIEKEAKGRLAARKREAEREAAKGIDAL